MAKKQKRYRCEAAFDALRLGHKPGSFDAFLKKLKKAEKREERSKRAITSGSAKRARATQLKKPRIAAEKRRAEKARSIWNPRRDALHMAFLEQGIDPIGLGGIVTERDLARVAHVYGGRAAQMLKRQGAGHRRGYVLNLDDMVLIRMRPDEWESGRAIALRNGEYSFAPVQAAIRRDENKGFIERAYSDNARFGTRRGYADPKTIYILFRLTRAGEARRAYLIEALGQLDEPVSAILRGYEV